MLDTYLKHLHPRPAAVRILVFPLCSRRKYIDFAGSYLGAIWEEYWVETPAAARIILREARKRARGSVQPHLAS